MTSRITGAEAAELVRGAYLADSDMRTRTDGLTVVLDSETIAVVRVPKDAADAETAQLAAHGRAELLAAAPDLAASLIAAESERDALRDAVRTMRDAEHDLGALRMKETESPGSVNTFDHTAAMDRRDHLTCELYELAGLREATGMTRLAYAEKMIREFILSLDSVPYGNVQNNLDKLKESIDNLREVVK